MGHPSGPGHGIVVDAFSTGMKLAARLGEQKARNVLATGADVLVTGNIGCLTQIDLHLRRLGKPVPMMHTIELLDRAMAQPVDPIVG